MNYLFIKPTDTFSSLKSIECYFQKSYCGRDPSHTRDDIAGEQYKQAVARGSIVKVLPRTEGRPSHRPHYRSHHGASQQVLSAQFLRRRRHKRLEIEMRILFT